MLPRTARRFRNSAKKRDPKRGWEKPGQSNRQGFEAIGRADEFKPFDPPAKAEEAQSWGEPDLYLIAAQTFDIGDPEKLGFDAAMEFPPHQVKRTDITDEMGIYNPEFTGAVLDYRAVVEAELQKPEPRYKLFRSSTLSWDNTARNQDAPRIMGRFAIDAYKRWTEHLCRQVRAQEKYSADEKIVFVNAWNEWAEGTHLEPDRRYGFAYLQATYDALPKKSASQINT